MDHFHKLGVLHLLAVFVKARRAEGDDEFLPFARCLADIDDRRGAFETLAISPALVNAAVVAKGNFLFPIAVKDLNLISALKINSRV